MCNCEVEQLTSKICPLTPYPKKIVSQNERDLRGQGFTSCDLSLLTTDSIQELWPQSPWRLHDQDEVDRCSKEGDGEYHQRGYGLEEERQEDKEQEYYNCEHSHRKNEPHLHKR